jgi:chromosome segregation ATPase
MNEELKFIRMKKWFILLLVPLALTSCNYKSKGYKTLEQEKDSLLLEEQKKTNQLNQDLAVINLVEENFEEIKKAENYVTFQTGQEHMQTDSMSQIVTDLDLIKTTLSENREKIANLNRQLAKSKGASQNLRKMIERLNKQIAEHTQLITQLRTQLAAKDVRIKELDDLVVTLNTSVDNLNQNVVQKTEQISTQEKQMNKVWYVFGTRKELKQQQIFTRSGLLTEGFNKNYFLEADSRSLKEIALYTKKAKLLTNHPASSYSLDKVNGYLVLKITDPNKFWDISKYLVIEVE